MKNKPDYILILAAGRGTRMGAIGQELPKVLWPVFDKSLLELQVLYAKSLGIDDIFINTHYYQEKIHAHIDQSSVFKDVSILHEEQILDVGGAIHNLAQKVDYKGRLLVINADQFFMLDKRIEQACESLSGSSCILFTTPVETKYGYNTLRIEDNLLCEIVDKNMHKENKVEQTYTGVCVVDLEKIQEVSGASKFFESVANYTQSKVTCLGRRDEEYWDFGTIKRYVDSSRKLVQEINSDGDFVQFIKENCNLKQTDDAIIRFKNLSIEENAIKYKEIIQTI